MRYLCKFAFNLILAVILIVTLTVPRVGHTEGEDWPKKAELAFLQKNWEGLVQNSSKWMDSEPNNPIARFLLALGLSELHRYDDAANQMSQASDYQSILKVSVYANDLQAQFPKNAVAQYLSGLCKAKRAFEGSVQLKLNALQRDKLFKEAEEAFRSAIRLDPKFLEPKIELASILGALRSKHDEAISLYKECISIDPQIEPAYRGMADEYLAIGRDAEARKFYEKCLLLPSAQEEKQFVKRQLALLAQKSKAGSLRGEKDWPAYKNQDYGLFFRYPKGWDFYDVKNQGLLPRFFVEEGGDKGLAFCLNPSNRDQNFNIRVVRGTPPSLQGSVSELDRALARMASKYRRISLEKISLHRTQAMSLVWQSERMGMVLLHKQVIFTHGGNTFTISCLAPQGSFKRVDEQFFRPFIKSIKLSGD